MVYLDARSQDGSSTHGSTSDDTGSSLSTMVDRFSSSDRVSTISTISTASTTSEQHGAESMKGDASADHYDDNQVKDFLTDSLNLSGMLTPFDQLERDFNLNQPDYLLTRLANSEAVTHVESRGDVERVTAVVAPNTVLIEETITLQPPLSFQDAPLSYGHETSPGLFYTDLAADSKTHFRPIKDDASIVESVNGDVDHIADNNKGNSDSRSNKLDSAPPLPIRNHVNRIPVNQQTQMLNGEKISSTDADYDREAEVPILPPKPMPRKDLKSKRKRPPPPPPPPATAPRKEVPPVPAEPPAKVVDEVNVVQVPEINKLEEKVENKMISAEIELNSPGNLCDSEKELCSEKEVDKAGKGLCKPVQEMEKIVNYVTSKIQIAKFPNKVDKFPSKIVNSQINKVPDIVEMKIKMSDEFQTKQSSTTSEDPEDDRRIRETTEKCRKFESNAVSDIPKENINLADMSNTQTLSIEFEDSEDERVLENREQRILDKKDTRVLNEDTKVVDKEDVVKPMVKLDFDDQGDQKSKIIAAEYVEEVGKEDNEETCSSDLENDTKDIEIKRCYKRVEEMEDDDIDDGSSDESDDGDYYWQSNLATIGEEEENNSLEYTNA